MTAPVTRRRFLASAGSATALGLAGCAGLSGSRGADGGRNAEPDAEPDSGSSSNPEGAAALTLDSLDVGGSPGGPVRLRPPGRVVLLDFFATWCAPCKPEMANLRAVRERFDPAEVAMVSITTETDTSAVRTFWRRYRGMWPVALDPALRATKRYGVTRVPTIIVLAPDGTRVMRHTGLAGERRLRERVRAALAQSEGE